MNRNNVILLLVLELLRTYSLSQRFILFERNHRKLLGLLKEVLRVLKEKCRSTEIGFEDLPITEPGHVQAGAGSSITAMV
jgi:hypothetical protein